jgi:hypothetical protein
LFTEDGDKAAGNRDVNGAWVSAVARDDDALNHFA